MILLAHPTANQNVRQTALALAEAQLLAEFWTCVSWKRGGLLDRLAAFNPRAQSELRRRSFARELQPFIRASPLRELARHVAGQVGLRLPSVGVDAVYDAFNRTVARRVARGGRVAAVYAYDGGALHSFRAARQRGLKIIYEHPVAYWRRVRHLQREEAEVRPEWTPTLLSLTDSDEKLAQKDEELSLADTIVVASSFARETLSDAPKLQAQVQVIPYGAPPIDPREIKRHDGPLRVLFVGALGQAKGLSYLLEAVKAVGPAVELTLIGHRLSPAIPTPEMLQGHRWIASLPHDEILAAMSRHDVLVSPSLHEGFGLSILEAMARGSVPIATPNSCAPDLVEDGTDGFIIPIRSSPAIAEKLTLLAADRDRLVAMKEAARRKAAQHGWEHYRARIAVLAREVIAH